MENNKKQRYCDSKKYELTPSEYRENFLVWKKSESKADISAASKIGIQMTKDIEYAHTLDFITGRYSKISKEKLLLFFEDKMIEIKEKPEILSNENCSNLSTDPRCYILKFGKSYQRKKPIQYECTKNDIAKISKVENDFKMSVNNTNTYIEENGGVLPKLKFIEKKAKKPESSNTVINGNSRNNKKKDDKQPLPKKKRKVEAKVDLKWHLNELSKICDMEEIVSDKGEVVYKIIEKKAPKIHNK
jgi:hypothetical protein